MMRLRMLLLLVMVSCAPAAAPSATLSDAELDDDARPTQDEAEAYAARPPRHCTARGALPDPTCTPGGVMTTDLAIVCHQSTKGRRNVPTSLKRQVFADYGIAYPQPVGTYEVDHDLPLCAGGSNAIENLWPQPAKPTPGYHNKDRLEALYCRRVCDGQMTLAAVQAAFTTDWLAAYQKEFGNE